VVEVKFQFPMLMAQFRKPTKWMWDAGRKWENCLKKFGDIGIVIGMFCMPLAFAFLLQASWSLLSGGGAQIAVMIPGVAVPGTNFRLPIVEGLVAIFLIAVFHEGMHGLMAAAHGVKSKFSLILLLVIPAAGVEIDEKVLADMKKKDRLRVLSAGSMGNFILALLAVGAFFIAAPIVESHAEFQGVEILNVSNPAIGLAPGDVVTGIEGRQVKDLESLVEAMEDVAGGQEITIETANGTVTGRTVEEDGKAMLGVLLTPKMEMSRGWRYAARATGFLLLLFNLNLGVGIINLLPAGFLDGGRMLEDLLGEWGKKIGRVALLLLLANVFLPYVLLWSG